MRSSAAASASGQFDAMLIDLISGPTFGAPVHVLGFARQAQGSQRVRLREPRSRAPVPELLAHVETMKRPSVRQPAASAGPSRRSSGAVPGWTERTRAVDANFRVGRSRTAIPYSRSGSGSRKHRRHPLDAVKRISTRFALLMAAAAVVPLLAYGAVSILFAADGAQQAVIQGNLNVARQRRRADRAVRHRAASRSSRPSAADLQQTGLKQWQQDRILKNFVLEFPEFAELTLLDDNGGAHGLEPARTADSQRARARTASTSTVR